MHTQQPFTGLINNLYPELVLLVRGQIAPVRNNPHEDLGYKSCSIPRCFNVRQVKARGIPDVIMLITDEKIILRHGDRNISQHGCPINLPRGLGSGYRSNGSRSSLLPSNACKDSDHYPNDTKPKGDHQRKHHRLEAMIGHRTAPMATL